MQAWAAKPKADVLGAHAYNHSTEKRTHTLMRKSVLINRFDDFKINVFREQTPPPPSLDPPSVTTGPGRCSSRVTSSV